MVGAFPRAIRETNVVEYIRDGTGVYSGASGRDLLVAGTYIPSATTAGLANPSATFTQVFGANAGAGSVDITTSGTRTNVEYWGYVRPLAAGITFKNCIFRGVDPTSLTANRGCIQCFGANPPHFTMIDCLVDPSGWSSFGSIPTKQVYVVGIHGGNFTAQRCEIKNVQDGVNYVGPSDPTAAANASCLMEQNWIHRCYYINAWTAGPADQQPHCDAFQFNTGQNITLRGNKFGGVRVKEGYGTWPGGTNLGDDYWNAGLMIKQEVDMTAGRIIENVLIEKNYFQGQVAGINHYYSTTNPNDFSSMTIRDNKFLQRQSDWGAYDANGQPGGAGWDIIRGNLIRSTYANNVHYETGLPVTITNGG